MVGGVKIVSEKEKKAVREGGEEGYEREGGKRDESGTGG